MSRPAPHTDSLLNAPTERLSDSRPTPQFAEVAVPVRLHTTFTYRLPLALREAVKIGARLLVPFGRKLVTAYVVALHTELDAGIELDEGTIKDAEELLDAEPLLTAEVVEITRWISEYYAAPWGEVLKAALPAGLNSSIEQVLIITSEGRDELARLPPRQAQGVRGRALQLIHESSEATMRQLARALPGARTLAAVRELERRNWITRTQRARTATATVKRRKAVRLAPLQASNESTARALTDAGQRAIETLITHNGEMPFAELIELADVSASTIGTLERRGLVETFVQDVRRDPLATAHIPDIEQLVLSAAQAAALDEITQAIEAHKFQAFLLHGVTGSGKTEVYIRAMGVTLAQNRSCLMLVPEIALTPVFSRRLRAHFGDLVAIFHSSLSTGERFDEWSRIRTGAARVVIGTRSAVFAPIANLGLIIVDEEHESSYRQQESPYYSGRDASIVRASKETAIVIMGSATPSLESYRNAERGKYRLLTLPQRVQERAMAQAELIDMRGVLTTSGRQDIFSEELLEAIEATHRRGEQTMILLNRRGYSSFVLCRSCGERVQCPNCDVTLTYHRSQRNLVCHYCDFRQRTPEACPTCQGQFIYFVGEGTEQIEDKLQTRFPDLRIARLDRDIATRRHAQENIIMRFAAHEIDLLVGTQMIAKGHDFPNVTLVGVVSVDAGLAMPDFRAAERAFQLITQVAGRAGRGRLPGRVLIQTYHPEHYALRHAAHQDYNAFYKEEIRYRRNLAYPPFVALASLLIHDEDFARVEATAHELKSALDAANTERRCRVLGPAPAPIARLRNEHRVQILVKSTDRAHLRTVLDLAIAEAETVPACDTRAINLEIDPVNLM